MKFSTYINSNDINVVQSVYICEYIYIYIFINTQYDIAQENACMAFI